MGWFHPDISLESLLNLIKGFVDILILASGYQSSGLPAVWDAQNIKKAVQWGIFFETVFRRLSISDYYHDSVKELDAALLEITSNPCFPQGLAQLSSATLTRARDFVLQYLLHMLPLRDAHLSALLTAAVEMDLDDLRGMEYDCLNVYLDKLMLQSASFNLVPDRRRLIEDSLISSPNVILSSEDQDPCDLVTNPCRLKDLNPGSPLDVPNVKVKEHASGGHSEFLIQELSKRQTSVSCILSVEAGLHALCNTITCINWIGSDNNLSGRQSSNGIFLLSEEQLVDFATWNQWRSRILSYFLDKRTVRLVSGAELIFSGPKVQWLQVFERLKVSTETCDDDFIEIIELLLLGCTSSRWTSLIEQFLSVSYDLLDISNKYHKVQNLLRGRSHFLHSKEDFMNSKENGILEYLTLLLGNQLHQLWKLPPVLAAVAIPSWSPLFSLYLIEIETLFKGAYSTIRCCSCIQDGKEHKDCELAERIWCLYVFQIQGSHLIVERGLA